MSHKKVFAVRFHTYWCGSTISFSSKSMALRVGNTEIKINTDELADLQHAQFMDDLSTPVGIYKAHIRETA